LIIKSNHYTKIITDSFKITSNCLRLRSKQSCFPIKWSNYLQNHCKMGWKLSSEW